jgi:pyruvate formate-lyase activating enzyme-like uncharacterized protein
MTKWHVFLGWVGIGNWCSNCGEKKVFMYKHGYRDYEVWYCPVCNKDEVEDYFKFKYDMEVERWTKAVKEASSLDGKLYARNELRKLKI